MLRRREFLHRSAAAGAALFAKKFSPSFFAPSSAADSRIEIVLDEPLGTISPNIYGHFAENLSGVIYDGIWVGEDSKVPNVNGIRKELLEEMRKIKPPVVRYPGGCFADSYDWRDGIGPRDKRPRRTNFWAAEESPS
jgi:alpha-N-arabinofuranosidase